MDRYELIKKIQELSFVKCELELFLDTHKDSRVALENYNDAVEALKSLRERYAAEYGPITACESGEDSWRWTDGPWPWATEFPHNEGKWKNGEVKG